MGRGVWRRSPFLALTHGSSPPSTPPEPGSSRRFRFGQSLLRLAEYQTAAVFGGLPLYVDGIWRTVLASHGRRAGSGWLVAVVRRGPLRAGPTMRLVLAAALAPPAGLLLLGAVFDNTPIELRYLSFGLPFIALLVAWSLRSRRCRGRCFRSRLASRSPALSACWFLPARCNPPAPPRPRPRRLAGNGDRAAAARAMTALASSAPSASRRRPLRLLLIRPSDPIAERIAPYRRVAVATLGQDRDSIAAIARLHASLVAPNWRLVAIGSSLEVYERTGARSKRCSSTVSP